MSISAEEVAVCNAKTGHIIRAFIALDNATPGDHDIDYKPLYYFLFNGISDALDTLTEQKEGSVPASLQAETVNILKKLHCDAEDLFLEQTEKKNKAIPITENKP